jgi:hypothetical protein
MWVLSCVQHGLLHAKGACVKVAGVVELSHSKTPDKDCCMTE